MVPALLSTHMCTHSDLHTHARSNPLFLQCLWECGGVLTVPVVPAFLSTHTCARIQIFTLTLAPTHFFAVPVGVWGCAGCPCNLCLCGAQADGVCGTQNHWWVGIWEPALTVSVCCLNLNCLCCAQADGVCGTQNHWWVGICEPALTVSVSC